MAAKTISMHASEDTARRVEHVARVEDRSPSQIASAALSFYLRLPPEAHAALRHVQALGTDEDVERVMRNIARQLLNAQYDVAVRQIGRELDAQGTAIPETEAELLVEAERMLAPEPPGASGVTVAPARARRRKAG